MPRVSATRHRSARRAVVHLLLVGVGIASLIAEPVLAVHIALGLTFVALVTAHLGQRRRTVRGLLGRLQRLTNAPSGRMALSDLALTSVTAVMLVSGIVDWRLGHPTRIRWHAISGVVLAGLLVVHTVRRRRRLLNSAVR